MNHVLTTQGLTKEYKYLKAVNNVNMNIPKGSIYGFVGKNGSGKTTLIRMVTGLITPTAGSFSLYGETSKEGMRKARRRIAAVVETPSMYLSMNAYDNLKTQCLVLGIDEGCINGTLKTVGLENTGNKKAKDFSLGMKQRLGIAVALLGEPDFLLLDEPTNGLDPEGIIEIRELLIRLNREKHITMLISSHILSELAKLATHYGFIDKGTLLKEISAVDLEAACRKCVVLNVSSVKTVPEILAKHSGIDDYKIISESEVEVYGNVQISGLVLDFAQSGVAVNKINERDENLESYYINLIGGHN